MKCGYIYKITNLVNGKIYIGLTTLPTVQDRFNVHVSNAKRHINRRLYDAMNCYGYDNFKIEEIEKCDSIDQLKIREIYWISHYDSTNNKIGYNMTEGGDGCDCIAHMSKEAKLIRSQKISSKLTGRKRPKDVCKKISETQMGKKLSEYTKQKMREQRLGKISVVKDNECHIIDKDDLEKYLNEGFTLGQPKRSEETCKRIGLSKLGTKQSEKTKKKRSESMSKLVWYNNGKEQHRFKTPPDSKEWKPGRLKVNLSDKAKRNCSHKGMHVYNNGIVNVTAYECPEGFVPGRNNKLKNT